MYNEQDVMKLLNMLSKERCNIEPKRYDIGLLLFNYGNKVNKLNAMFKCWKKWNSKSTKYVE